MKRRMMGSLAALLFLACGGSDPGPDAAVVDADTVDAARDDAGHDAAPPVDAFRFDTGPTPTGCAASYSGCVDFEDHHGEPIVDVAFDGFAYSPQCMRVDPGTVVRIPASPTHPLLHATCSPDDSPLPRDAARANGMYTFANVGTYGYYCIAHGNNAGVGMAGLIVVE